MTLVSYKEFREYFEREGELLPFVSNYIKEFGRLPESIPISNLDFEMLRKVLSIEEEFFDNLRVSELTDEVWEKMIVLNPEEYWEISPSHINSSKNVILAAIDYNQNCMNYFNDEQSLLLAEILFDKKIHLANEEFIEKYATKQIIDVITRNQNIDFLTELFGAEIFDKKIGNYIFKKQVCKNSSIIIEDNLLLKEPKEYYKEIYKKGISYIQYFPENYQNRELWEDAVVKKPNLLKVLPNKYSTKSFFDTVFEKNVKTIKYIPKEFLNQQKCDMAYEENIQLISSFPESFITNSMIQDTIDRKGNIDYIINIAEKRGLINANNFKKLISYSLKYLTKINKEYYDRKYIEELLSSDKWTGVISNMDLTYFDYDLLYKCASHSLKILKRLLPHEHINKLMDERILQIYLTSDYIRLDLINDKFLTIDVLRIALEKNKEALSTLPEERRTSERYRIAAEYGYCDSNAPLFIKNQLKEKQLKKVIHNS